MELFHALRLIDERVEALARRHLAAADPAPVAVAWEPVGDGSRTVVFHPHEREQRWLRLVPAGAAVRIEAAAQTVFPVEDELYAGFCRSGAELEHRWSAAGIDDGLTDAYRSLWSWRLDAEAGAWIGDGLVEIAPFPATRGLPAGAG